MAAGRRCARCRPASAWRSAGCKAAVAYYPACSAAIRPRRRGAAADPDRRQGRLDAGRGLPPPAGRGLRAAGAGRGGLLSQRLSQLRRPGAATAPSPWPTARAIGWPTIPSPRPTPRRARGPFSTSYLKRSSGGNDAGRIHRARADGLGHDQQSAEGGASARAARPAARGGGEADRGRRRMGGLARAIVAASARSCSPRCPDRRSSRRWRPARTA